MTITPAFAAKLANARRTIAEQLEQWGSPQPEERAGQLLDLIRNLGWTPPGPADDERIPAPGRSTPAGREAARRLYAETRAAVASTTTGRSDQQRSTVADIPPAFPGDRP